MRPIGDHLGVAELDSGLHHDADRPRKGGLEPGGRKGGAVDLEGAQGGFGPRDLQVIERFGGSSRHRHLGTDDVARTTSARCRLGYTGEASRPFRRHLVGQSRGVAATPHAGIEMKLAEARPRIGVDHRLGLAEGLFGRQRLPGVGAEMVATQDQQAPVEPNLPRDTVDEVAEARRRHPGVAAILVDLVARRLDQDRGSVRHALQKGGFDREGVGRADGRDADARAGLATRRQIRDGRRCHDIGLPDAIKASSSAKVAAPSIGP